MQTEEIEKTPAEQAAEEQQKRQKAARRKAALQAELRELQSRGVPLNTVSDLLAWKRSENAKRRAQAAQSLGVKPGAYKLEEARLYCGGYSAPVFRRFVERGLLKPCRVGRHLLFPISELDRFLKEGMSP